MNNQTSNLIDSPKVLIFTSYCGGHKIVAEETRNKVLSIWKNATVEIRSVDNIWPKIFGWDAFAYFQTECNQNCNYPLATAAYKTLKFFVSLFLLSSSPTIQAIIEEKNPTLVISTMPFLNEAIHAVCTNKKTPLVVITTDFDHSAFWLDKGLLLDPAHEEAPYFYCIPSKCFESEIKTGKGLNKKAIRAVGYPVRAPLERQYSPGEKASFRKEIGVLPNEKYIPIVMGSLGGAILLKYAEQILSDEASCKFPEAMRFDLFAGKNKDLKQDLQKLLENNGFTFKLESGCFNKPGSSIRFAVHEFKENIHVFMAAADLIITKAGPGSFADGIYQEVPMIMDYTQGCFSWEELNITLMTGLQIGERCEKLLDLSSKITTILTNHNEYLENIKKFKEQRPLEYRYTENIEGVLQEAYSLRYTSSSNEKPSAYKTLASHIYQCVIGFFRSIKEGLNALRAFFELPGFCHYNQKEEESKRFALYRKTEVMPIEDVYSEKTGARINCIRICSKPNNKSNKVLLIAGNKPYSLLDLEKFQPYLKQGIDLVLFNPSAIAKETYDADFQTIAKHLSKEGESITLYAHGALATPVQEITLPILEQSKSIISKITGFFLRTAVFQVGVYKESWLHKTLTELYSNQIVDFNRIDKSIDLLKKIGGIEQSIQTKDGLTLKGMLLQYEKLKDSIKENGGILVERELNGETLFSLESREGQEAIWAKYEKEVLEKCGFNKCTFSGKQLFVLECATHKKKQCFIRFHSPGISYAFERKYITAHLGIGKDVFLFDYRGSHKSQGSPSEAGYYLDAEAVLEHVQKQGYAISDLWATGFCGGAATATHAKTKYHKQGLNLVMENSFNSLELMIKKSLSVGIYGIKSLQNAELEVLYTVPQDGFNSLQKIKNLQHKNDSHVIIMETLGDDKIPEGSGKSLYQASLEKGNADLLTCTDSLLGHDMQPWQSKTVWPTYKQIINAAS